PLCQPDRSGQARRRARSLPRSYTTPRDTIPKQWRTILAARYVEEAKVIDSVVAQQFALPLYQQTRPLMEQRRRWLAIALSIIPRCKVFACPTGSGFDGQTRAPG